MDDLQRRINRATLSWLADGGLEQLRTHLTEEISGGRNIAGVLDEVWTEINSARSKHLNGLNEHAVASVDQFMGAVKELLRRHRNG